MERLYASRFLCKILLQTAALYSEVRNHQKSKSIVEEAIKIILQTLESYKSFFNE